MVGRYKDCFVIGRRNVKDNAENTAGDNGDGLGKRRGS
jgi:hypothetical protein